ncbi:hypothetical protein Btru_038738 [Bulinus truncatus]|nr:hypothetical protein Btru_038738 [Bulinus truncatus]
MANYVISERLKLQTDVCEKKKFEKYVQKYQSIAVQILETCYREDWKLTMFSLIRELAKWKESCVTIAMTMKNKQFLQLRACCDVNSQAWSTYHGEDLDLDEHQGNFYEKWLSPKIRCRMDMIGYLLFLTAYSVLLVTYLSAKTFHFLEGVVIAYMLIFFLKELDQCCSKMCRNSKLCREYIMDPFNIIDLVTIVISFAAWELRWAAFHLHDEQEWMKSARYLLSLNFMLYMFRFLEFFYLSKFLGPILVFIRHMVKTFLHFLLILMIFLVAYAVASESILYPETELTPDNVYNIFRKAFWAMMGEYWLDEISGDDCASNSTVYNNLTNQRCPTADGRFTVPVLLGIYVVFVQILMFNLLIALFTNAITENESKRDQIWRYQRLQLTMQYSETRLLLPPFTPLIFWLNSRVGNPFISRIPKQKIDLKHFEHTAAQKIIKKIMDYSLGKDHLDEEKKVNIKSVDATTKEILQLLKKERRGSVTFRAAQTNEMPAEKHIALI